MRVSPRAWGIERDLRLRDLLINTSDQEYHLKQSRMDSQVWMIAEKNKDKFKVLGLIICYVDDMLCLMEDGKIKQALFEALQSQWTMSTEGQTRKKSEDSVFRSGIGANHGWHVGNKYTRRAS